MKKTENFNDTNEHFAEIIESSLDRSLGLIAAPIANIKSYDFKNVYVLNFRFWQKLDIKQVRSAYDDPDAIKGKAILPFLYAVSFERGNDAQFCYGISRGTSCWYLDFRVTDHTGV